MQNNLANLISVTLKEIASRKQAVISFRTDAHGAISLEPTMGDWAKVVAG